MSVIIYFETVSDLVYTPPTFPRSENQHSHITPHRCPPTYTFRWGYSRCCGLTTCNFPAAVWDDMRGRSVRWVWRGRLSPCPPRSSLVPAISDTDSTSLPLYTSTRFLLLDISRPCFPQFVNRLSLPSCTCLFYLTQGGRLHRLHSLRRRR